jgi:hypothetical protein
MLKKRIIVAIISILIITSVVLVYFSEASVNYWVTPFEIKLVDNHWYSNQFFDNTTGSPGSFVQLQVVNKGLLDASFYVIIKSTNATFAEKPFEAAQIIDSHQLKIPYTLHVGERTNTNVTFSIDNSTNVFEIIVSFEPNQWFIRSAESNWAGQNSFRYSRTENNTWIASMIL